MGLHIALLCAVISFSAYSETTGQTDLEKLVGNEFLRPSKGLQNNGGSRQSSAPADLPPGEDDSPPGIPPDSGKPLTLVLKGMVTPDVKGDPKQIQEAAINFFFNSFSKNPRLVSVNPESIRDGKVSIESFGKGQDQVGVEQVFNLKGFDRELRSSGVVNPYACDPNSQGEFRFDWLVHTALRPNFYNTLLRLPGQWQTLADELKVDNAPPERATRNPDKVYVSRSRISSSGRGRVLEFQQQEGRTSRFVWRSTDFDSRRTASVDPTVDPLNYKGGAGEFIFNLPNGVQAYYLANAKGQQQGEAPGSIVKFNARLASQYSGLKMHGPEIESPRDCMLCHGSGVIGQGFVSRDFDVKDLLANKRLNRQQIREIAERWAKGQEYRDQAKEYNSLLIRNLKRAKAFVGEGDEMFPILPEIDAVYQRDVDFKQLAKELDTTEDALEQELSGNGAITLRKQLGIELNAEGKIGRKDVSIPRHVVEQLYCQLKEGLTDGGQPPLENNGREPSGESHRGSSPPEPGPQGRLSPRPGGPGSVPDGRPPTPPKSKPRPPPPDPG